ncbi:MAG: response regulator transcription factor [Eubacterium sp.]|nr:response regulator transcription factor [Eubacterium sp.]
MSRVLIVEDELAISKMLCLNLGLTGYETVPLFDGSEVLDWLGAGNTADIALVDIMMPHVNGFELLAPLKEKNIPVIILTARTDIDSKVKGLVDGAEDYMVKPFEMVELLVRIDKILQRYGSVETVINLGNVDINLAAKTVIVDGKPVSITPMEFKLLSILAKNKNIAMDRNKLLADVWGIDYIGETRTVDVHVAQLRKKTGLTIVNVPKYGYRLEVTP